MIVTIEGPSFYGQDDEEVFFACLYSLPEFEKVVGVGLNLEIHFKSSVSGDVIRRLLVICRRWGVDVSSLKNQTSCLEVESLFWDKDISLP
ncbi:MULTISPECIES: hypothetical protein [Vibrio]|uniref:hypothetical protein n=1 Tax=Vibrio TaxID=662 RepID=UPI0005C6A577|nr:MULTISPECIES: hypothetical protein [Vibrio]NVC74066.1 hypothetical protein [Vibrio vulnificus]PNM43064.1 hypothetical protein AL469_024480 [Vibrio harveyi]PQJ40025.1 hypothetical protein BTO00_21580 [Vibrio campbellii]BCL69926.1 hypothetical protein VNTUMSATTG_18630 [Vibrio nigripulchritudo]BDU31273.1 hypothetical protein TUMSATVNIG1_18820 [Vibrio nigripulchritudo]